MKNIEDIYSKGLCSGCGACKMVCNVGAIDIHENMNGFLHSVVDTKKCIDCGRCLEICVGNYSTIKSNIDSMRGNIANSYIGYATSSTIRQNGQSGGVISAIITSMLEQKMIESAWINSFNSKKNANEYIEICESSGLTNTEGSYYAQTSLPLHINDNSVITLLGCQAEALNRINKNIYKIGLFCAGNFSRKYYERLEYLAGIKKEERVKEFRFRDKKYNGWPGNVRIVTNTNEYELQSCIRMAEKKYYQCFRCDLCNDIFCVNSDLAVGDPWGIDLDEEEKKKGVSVILVRTKRGQEMLNQAIKGNYINVKPIDTNKIIIGQGINEEYINKKKVANRKCRNNIYNKDDELINNRISLEEQYLLSLHRNISTQKKDIVAEQRKGIIKEKILLILKRLKRKMFLKR